MAFRENRQILMDLLWKLEPTTMFFEKLPIFIKCLSFFEKTVCLFATALIKAFFILITQCLLTLQASLTKTDFSSKTEFQDVCVF